MGSRGIRTQTYVPSARKICGRNLRDSFPFPTGLELGPGMDDWCYQESGVYHIGLSREVVSVTKRLA